MRRHSAPQDEAIVDQAISEHGVMNVPKLLFQIPARLLIGMVRAYQLLISPLLGQNCRFTPTCSRYFIEAVEKHGVIRGSWRGMRRLLRCHPFHPGGYDPP